MRTLTVLVCLLALGAAVPSVAAPPGLPPEGPDVPVLTQPATVVTAFEDEVFSFEESAHTHAIAVPPGTWDRIVLVFRARPDGDPWDRVFGVAFGAVEVLRGTTPRADFTVRKDVTEFASLLPPGGTADISLLLSTYVGRQLGTVRLEFYAAEPTAPLVASPASAAVGAIRWGYLTGNGRRLTASASFPTGPSSAATIEMTLTGHADEEAWFLTQRRERVFHVFVDGTEIGQAIAMPYTYAFLGFSGVVGEILHPLMWWTAQQALDVAGVHLGVGEIPPYRVTVDEANLPLLTGARTIEITQQNGRGYWITSLAFLLNA